MAENLVSTQTIAKIFGVSTRRVEQLKSDGIIKGQGKPTKYDLLSTIKMYIKYLSDKAYDREKKETDMDNTSRKLKAEADFREAKAEREKMRLQELNGELHNAEDVEAIVTYHVYQLRSMLLSLPGRIAVDCAEANSAAEVSDVIKKEVYAILNSLADFKYDKNEYLQMIREREGLNAAEETDKETI